MAGSSTKRARKIVISGFSLTLILGAGALGTSCGTSSYMANDVSYTPAGGWNDPNTEVIRGTATRKTVTNPEQRIKDLHREKASLQRQIDRLGEELTYAKKKRSKQIVYEMEQLAMETDRIDAEIRTMETLLAQERERERARERARIIEIEEYQEEAVVVEPQPAVKPQVTYSVQVALVTRPNMKAFSELGASRLKEVRRSDGYAYYYGEYTTKYQADEACRHLKRQRKYHDAFVVALRGDQRISLTEAQRELGR